MLTRKRKAIFFVAITLVSLFLYLLFPSIQWDLNGLVEAQSIDAGRADMFSPNHMLYRPTSFVIFKVWQLLGYTGNSVPILQAITAVSAALGIGFFFLALYHLTEHLAISIIGTGFLATSWSYWRFSTDVYYITPAAMFVTIVLALLLCKKQIYRSILAIGVMVGLSILFWQANVFLVFSTVVALWWLKHPNRFGLIIAFLVVVGLVVGLAYILTPVLIFERHSLADILTWGFSHSSDGVERPQIWGRWELGRFFPAVTSAVASFIPVWQGLGLRDLWHGYISPDKFLSLLSFFAFLTLSGLTLIFLMRQSLKDAHQLREIAWLLLGYMLFWPFIVWWDPYEPKWFVIPNLFLVAAITKIWYNRLNFNRLWVFGTCITIIGLANFNSTIWPYHVSQNPYMQVAQCFTKQTTKSDTFIPTDWNWFDYATYQFGYQGEVLKLKRDPKYQKQNFESIMKEVVKKRQQGGNVYVTDLNSYSADTLEYFSKQVGIPMEVLTQFQQKPAFTCNNWQFMKIVY